MGAHPGTHVHTADNAVPPLGHDLAGLLDDLAGIHPGIDLIRDGARLIALDRHTPDSTQTLTDALAGSRGADVISLIAALVQRITDPNTNPALRHLPAQQQNDARLNGQRAAWQLDDPDLHQPASEASAAITGT